MENLRKPNLSVIVIRKISSAKFRLDNSARTNYISITLLWEFGEFKPNAKVLGYCDGSSIQIEPREDKYGVLFNYKGEEIWMHVFKTEFDFYLQNINKST